MKQYILKSTKSKKVQKITNEAIEILEAAGIPIASKSQRGLEKMALAFLAVAGVTKDWSKVKSVKDSYFLKTRDIINYLNKFLRELLNFEIIQNQIDFEIKGSSRKFVSLSILRNLKIPFPPLNIQQKLVSEIEAIEKQDQKAVEELEKLQNEIERTFKNIKGKTKRFDEVCELKAGNFVKAESIINEYYPNLYACYGGNGLRGYTETFTNEGQFSLVGRQGALCGNVHLVSGKFHATEHALVAYPKENIDTIWLHYQLVFMNLNQYATGTAQPGLSVMNLNPIEIPVPTIAEQKKLVSQIENIEKKMADIVKQIDLTPKQKEKILKKYLV
ncbi:MAG: restriction endonuclease subunit S [Chryseotalea sp. WA131a]|nr:MAG: restriction endonuclease subunit S [Chryseotalea sp. WA131a]